MYALTYLLLAYVSFRLYYRKPGRRFLKFVFPKKIYLHPSAKVDYGLYLVNLLISPLILAAAGSQAWISIQVAEQLIALNGGEPVVRGNWSAATFAFFILGYTLVADLSVYLIHRLHHQWSVLWPLHALHHSAEVMTPFTLFRKHPLWIVSSNLLKVLLTGLFQGVFVFIFYGNPEVYLLFGLNTLYVVYNFFGANLRHSHIWLSWGPTLSHLFISPAMHQLHHNPERMRCNYGEIFAIWDWMFGTLYIPRGRERFAIGLPEGNPHDSLAKAYYVPVVELFKQIGAKLAPRKRQPLPRR